jgi:hypothetical protein
MAFDPLKSAMDATKAATSNLSIPKNATDAKALGSGAAAAVTDTANAAIGQANAAASAAQAKLDALAKFKDPEFIKKEAEARAMALVADKQQEVLAQKAEIEKQITEKLTILTDGIALALTIYLAFPPKLPAIDVKALAKKAYQKTKKEIRELRQKISKENLKKGKETFKYPMKPKELSIPKIPEIPKLPEIPKIPDVPKLPTVSVPKITLPKLP